MSGISPEAIEKIAGRTLSERLQVPEMLAWLKDHKQRFTELVAAFDQVVDQFTNTFINEIPEECIHARRLKELLGNTALPMLNEMSLLKYIGRAKNLFCTMKQVDVMMARGETTKEEPYLAFHQTKTNMEALMIGAIIHIAEEYYLAHAQLPKGIQRGDIELALEEMLSLHKENPLWDAVANTKRLNWVDGYALFSSEFRVKQGLS